MTYRTLTVASLFALLSACSSQPGPSAVNPLVQGQNAYLAGDYVSAELAYDGALSADPSNKQAMLGLAEVYEQTGRTSQAIDLYNRIQQTRTGAIRVWNGSVAPQDGVTEVAARRLGVLGTGVAQAQPTYAVPQTPVFQSQAPAAQAPALSYQTQPVLPNTSGGRTIVYTGTEAFYADQPVQSFGVPAIETYSAPAIETFAAPAPVQQSVVYSNEPTVIQPAIQSFYTDTAPAPVVNDDSLLDPWEYALDDDGSVTYAQPVETGLDSALAPAYEFLTPVPAAPATVAPSSIYEFEVPQRDIESLAPAQDLGAYLSAPIDPSEILTPDYSRFAPAEQIGTVFPVATTPVASPASYSDFAATTAPQQAGYTVIDGDIVYIGAGEIANGAVAVQPASPTVYEFDGYTPQETMNGFPRIDLN